MDFGQLICAIKIINMRILLFFIGCVLGILSTCYFYEIENNHIDESRRDFDKSTLHAKYIAKIFYGNNTKVAIKNQYDTFLELWIWAGIKSNDSYFLKKLQENSEIVCLYFREKPLNDFVKKLNLSNEEKDKLEGIFKQGEAKLTEIYSVRKKDDFNKVISSFVSLKSGKEFENFLFQFSYFEDVVNSLNETLKMTDNEYSITEDDINNKMYFQYEMSGKTERNKYGNYNLIYLLNPQLIMICPMDKNDYLVDKIKLKKFNKIIINSNGVWSIKE